MKLRGDGVDLAAVELDFGEVDDDAAALGVGGSGVEGDEEMAVEGAELAVEEAGGAVIGREEGGADLVGSVLAQGAVEQELFAGEDAEVDFDVAGGAVEDGVGEGGSIDRV